MGADPRSEEVGASVTVHQDAGDQPARSWRLLDGNGRPYASDRPGTLAGHRRTRIYGRLDCPAALRAIARGGYVAQRVFFADEATAIAAGYRPCAVCLPERYAAWQRDPAAFARFARRDDVPTHAPQRIGLTQEEEPAGRAPLPAPAPSSVSS